MNFRTHRYAPVLVLLVLSPLVAEVLFGATPISRLGALLPVTAIYGGGAVLVRELARRRGPGWSRIVLLGAAYAIVEEGLALQSMFNPDLFNAGLVGGRMLGVNWVWSEWTVGYHVVWSISIPILLAELLFPARRAEPWLGRIGVAVVGVVYTIGVLVLAYSFRLIITPDFRTPLALEAGSTLLAIGLVGLALVWTAAPARPPSNEPVRNAPAPWLGGLVAFLAAGAWFGLLDLPHVMRTGVLVLVPMTLGVVLAAGMAALIRQWSAPGRRWSDQHSLALAFGPLLVSMLWGFFFVTAGNHVDQLGQGAASVVAVVLLMLFARRLRERGHVAAESGQEN
ncbi:Uncharacterised protein [uncultured archaeon]|nr:Uncharacterised protein [uncultured archaeon]